jgi:hypothetical protein
LHWAFEVHGVQLQGPQRPAWQVCPSSHSVLEVQGRHLGCESPPRPPEAETRAVGPISTRSPTSKMVPPAPPPAESLPLEQPLRPLALMTPSTWSRPSCAAVAAKSTTRPPPKPARRSGSKPSRQPLSPPAAPSSGEKTLWVKGTPATDGVALPAPSGVLVLP